MAELLGACDRVWPRAPHAPEAVLKNELARQMLVGGQHIDVQYLQRNEDEVCVSLSRAGLVVSHFKRQNPTAAAWSDQQVKLKDLLRGDPCFRLEPDPDDRNLVRLVLDLQTLRDLGAGGDGAANGGGGGGGSSGGAPSAADGAPRRRAAPPATRYPFPNNVDVAATGLIRPASWRKALASGLCPPFVPSKVCARCGFRGHVASNCSLPLCGRCHCVGHDSACCGRECARCGIGGGGGELEERNRHRAGECPFAECERCGHVGHSRQDLCRGGPYASQRPLALPPQPPPQPQQQQQQQPVAAAAAAAGAAVPAPAAPTTVEVALQLEAIVDRMFEKMPEAALELVGDAGSRLLTAALTSGGRSAFEAIMAAVDRGSGAVALSTVRAAAAGAAALARPAATAPAPAPQQQAPARAPQQQPQQQGPSLAPDVAAELEPLCDAVWPPDAAPHPLLKGELAKLLLRQAQGPGGGGGVEGSMCWLPLAVAGPRLLAFWRSEQQLFPAGPDAPPPFSSVAAMLSGDPYLSCRTRTGIGEAYVVLDAAKLARWGAVAPLPSYADLLRRIDDAWDPTGGDGGASEAAAEAVTLVNWLAKLLAAAGNPGAATWGPSAAARASANDWGYCLEASSVEEHLRSMWAANPATSPRPYPAQHTVRSLLQGRPFFRPHFDPRSRSTINVRMDVYALTGCRRPLPGDGEPE
ncbi:hypothetical protein Rsub_02317 [Raphidocelis subcapitata]|uniref:CCHC-type domain-containing protein n=1 Tax=Raphidocelis subcapitata TaxID=307507 RepID=A0A2V0NQN3_9CHLO|nr:hypothetical protein Rsub_02317 [Raphidocelis subcapitata]|eukprot:GBF89599.1 hypothetical protein Rsub_02317 [Raphidocelis subcapitata]